MGFSKLCADHPSCLNWTELGDLKGSEFSFGAAQVERWCAPLSSTSSWSRHYLSSCHLGRSLDSLDCSVCSFKTELQLRWGTWLFSKDRWTAVWKNNRQATCYCCTMSRREWNFITGTGWEFFYRKNDKDMNNHRLFSLFRSISLDINGFKIES